MATTTIVITYDPAVGEVGNKVTGVTVSGRARASQNVGDIGLALDLMDQAIKLIASPTNSNANSKAFAAGTRA